MYFCINQQIQMIKMIMSLTHKTTFLCRELVSISFADIKMYFLWLCIFYLFL